MGFWSKLSGIGAMVGGGALAVMGNPAGLALMNVGTGLLSHDEQKAAIDKAQTAQTAAADKAQALQHDIYQQTRADLSPYMAYGPGAMNNLGSMVGLPPPAALPTADQSGDMRAMAVPATIGDAVNGAQRRSPEMIDPETQQAARVATESAYRPPRGSIGAAATGLVTVRAPNGQTQEVPREHVEYYVAKGAEVI